MSASITISTRTLVAAGAVVVVAGGAYLVGSTVRAGSAPASTVVYSAAPAADASSTAQLPGITVSGIGTVNGTPNTLTLQLTVTQTKSNVSDALAAASSTMNNVDSALTGSGVASADLSTSGASVQPNYQYDNGSQSINGYTATESLTATLRSISKAGSQINAAVQAGGNATSVNGVSLDIQNDASLMSSARSAAFTDAQNKAQQYASAAHETLGKAIQVTETVNTPSPVQVYNGESKAASSAASSVPINAGTAQISVTVTVVFAVS